MIVVFRLRVVEKKGVSKALRVCFGYPGSGRCFMDAGFSIPRPARMMLKNIAWDSSL